MQLAVASSGTIARYTFNPAFQRIEEQKTVHSTW